MAELVAPIDLITLDPTSSPPKLWASIRYQLVPIIDRGGSFEVGPAVNSHRGLVHPGYIVADPRRNRVLVYALSSKYKVRALDLTTGPKRTFLSGVSDLAMAPDGTIYATGVYGSGVLLRFDAEGRPRNWPGRDSNKLRVGPYSVRGLGLGMRGLAVGPRGRIYFIRNSREFLAGYLYRRVRAVGVKWCYQGMSPVPASERLWGDPSCVCITSRLKADGFGRVFLPNCFLSCVELIDTNGNRLLRIGTYGNADDVGPGIHFAWPAFVDVAQGKLYVADSVNRRITVVGFDYAAEEVAPLP